MQPSGGLHQVWPPPIICIIDDEQSHTDKFGSLATTPMYFTNLALRNLIEQQSQSWRNLDFVPPRHKNNTVQ